MKTISTQLSVVALALCAAATPALAGKGGSADAIRQAYRSGSTDATVAEVERAEHLICEDCVQLVTNMTEDSRYAIREVAAWWFAKRPAMQKQLAELFVADLASGGSVKVRNAADFLGRTVTFTALPSLKAAIQRDVDAEAKLAIVRAVDYMGHRDGAPILQFAMADRDAGVRASAVRAWRDLRNQSEAAPAVALLTDASADVRAEAATTVGGLRGAAGREALDRLVVSDPSPIVRRNAAWALGQLGLAASRDALARASTDESGLVRMTARASLGKLH